MADMVKKISIIICLILVVSLATGCTESEKCRKQVEKDVTEIMELIKEGKEDELYDCFSEYAKEQMTSDKLKEMIGGMYTFIDGNITEYSDYSEGTCRKTKSEGEMTLYYAGPIFKTVKTDNGKSYEIHICYYLINDEDESRLGVSTIHIFDKSNRERMYDITYH